MWLFNRFVNELCVLVLFLGTGFYVTGFASPVWYNIEETSSNGLWTHCDSSPCIPDDGRSLIQFLECGGLLTLCVGAAYILYKQFWNTSTSRMPVLVITSAFSGVCGLSGSLIFYGLMKKHLDDGNFITLGWSWALNLTGSILLIFGSILAFIINHPHHPPPPSDEKMCAQEEGASKKPHPLGQDLPGGLGRVLKIGEGDSKGVLHTAGYPGGYILMPRAEAPVVEPTTQDYIRLL